MGRGSKIVELKTLTLRIPMHKSTGIVPTKIEFIHEASHPDLKKGTISLLSVKPVTELVWNYQYIAEYLQGLSQILEETFDDKFRPKMLIEYSPKNIRAELLSSMKIKQNQKLAKAKINI
jgi:hypothetical protein